MKDSDGIVIIPTYNEKENVENIVRAVFGEPKKFHVLIIDDGSPDRERRTGAAGARIADFGRFTEPRRAAVRHHLPFVGGSYGEDDV